MSGTLVYLVRDGNNTFRSLRLTVCTEEDRMMGDLASQRRKRLSRILHEALGQGARLSYRDLSMIMLSSKATLKRDVSLMRKMGINLPLGGKTALER